MADLENVIYQDNFVSILDYARHRGRRYIVFAAMCIAEYAQPRSSFSLWKGFAYLPNKWRMRSLWLPTPQRVCKYFHLNCLVLGCSFSFVENSVTGALINYIPSAWNKPILASVTFISATEGLTSIFVVILTVVSNDYFGPSKTIASSTFLYLTGLAMLGFSVMNFSLESSYALFVVGGVLVSIGKAVKRPVLREFLLNQFSKEHNCDIDDQVSENIDRVHTLSYFAKSCLRRTKSCLRCVTDIWWIGVCAFGVICSIIIDGAIMPQSEKLDFIVSSNVLLVAGLLFWCGCPFYISNKPARTSRSIVFNVTKEEAKNMLKMIPMWAVFLIYTFVKMTSSTLFFLRNQEFEEDVQFSDSLLLMISRLSEFLCSKIYRFFILKSGEKEKDMVLVQIGVGLTCSLLCCIIAYKIELSGQTGSEISPNWMIPLFICVGLMTGLAEGGLDDLQEWYIPESWDLYGLSLNELVLGLFTFLNIPFIYAFDGWFKDSVNTSRLDHYYLVLVILCVPNCLLCFYVCTLYRGDTDVPIVTGDMIEHRIDVSTEQLETHPTPIGAPQVGTEIRLRKIHHADEDRSESGLTREIHKTFSLNEVKYKGALNRRKTYPHK